MLVQAVSLNTNNANVNRVKRYNNQSNKTLLNSKKSDSFKPSFNGRFESILEESVIKTFKKDYQLELNFNKLLQTIIGDSDIEKTENFYKLFSLYGKFGIRGLLKEFNKVKPQEKVAKIIGNDETHTVVLATKNGKSIFELFNFDNSGFFSGKSREVKFIFHNPETKVTMEYGLTSKGRYEICQTSPQKTTITNYYTSTGHRRYKISQFIGSNPTEVYYNKSGERSFWKNLFLGGPIISHF